METRKVDLAGFTVRRFEWHISKVCLYLSKGEVPEDSPELEEMAWRRSLPGTVLALGYMKWVVEKVTRVIICAAPDQTELCVTVRLKVRKIQGIGVGLEKSNPPDFQISQ